MGAFAGGARRRAPDAGRLGRGSAVPTQQAFGVGRAVAEAVSRPPIRGLRSGAEAVDQAARGRLLGRRVRASVSEIRELARHGSWTLATVRTLGASSETRARDGEQVARSVPSAWDRVRRTQCRVNHSRKKRKTGLTSWSTTERSAATVRDVWVVAARTVFAWAVKRKHTKQNPFKTVHVSVPRKKVSRPHKAFNTDEIKIILRAALTITDTATASGAARRWVPWLCAYTGARVGEIMQLRGLDVDRTGRRESYCHQTGGWDGQNGHGPRGAATRAPNRTGLPHFRRLSAKRSTVLQRSQKLNRLRVQRPTQRSRAPPEHANAWQCGYAASGSTTKRFGPIMLGDILSSRSQHATVYLTECPIT